MARKKRTDLSAVQKLEILDLIGCPPKCSFTDVARRYCLDSSTVSKLYKNREQIRASAVKAVITSSSSICNEFSFITSDPTSTAGATAIGSGSTSTLQFTDLRKRSRTRLSEEMDVPLFTWYKNRLLLSSTSVSHPLSDNVIKSKALKLSDEMGIREFKATNGWLDRWKKRFNVGVRRDLAELHNRGGEDQNHTGGGEIGSTPFLFDDGNVFSHHLCDIQILDEHSVTDNSMPGGGVHDAHSGGSSSHSGSLSGLEAVMAVAAAAAAANPSSLPPTGGGLDGGGESDGGGTSMGLPNVSTGGGLGGMEDRQSSHDAAGLNPLHMPNLLNSLSSPSPTSRHTSANSTAGNGDNYQLRHNNHLSLVFNQLAEDEDFMDVTLTAEGKSVKAHKSVLSAVSPYFSEVLRSNPCQHPIVIMPRDIAYNELSSMIKYIYRGEVTVSAEDLPSLLKTAQILQISGLSDGNLNNSPQMKNISRNSAPQNVTPNSMDNSTSTNNPVSLFSSSNSNLSLSTFNTVKNIFNSNYNAMNKQSHNKSSTITPQRLINIAPRPIIDENDKSQTDEGNSLPMDDSHDPNNEQTMLNPSDFMDLDMTCVKEELQSDEEEDHSELMDAPSTPKEVTTPPPIQHPSLSTSPATPSTSNSNDPPKSDVTMKIKDDQSNIEKELKQQNSLKTLANLANMNTNLSPGGSSDINEDNTAVENTSDDNLTEPSPNVCPYCSNYITTSELNTHLSSKHAFKPAFVCSTCNRVYTRKHSHENHYKKCSSEES